MEVKVVYSAEGHHINGCRVLVGEFCGGGFDEFTIDSNRWYMCNTPHEKEALMLNIARLRYPEVNWEHAHYIEVKQV